MFRGLESMTVKFSYHHLGITTHKMVAGMVHLKHLKLYATDHGESKEFRDHVAGHLVENARFGMGFRLGGPPRRAASCEPHGLAGRP